MQPGGFVLAATTNDLGREPEVRDVADVLEFRMDKATDPLTQLADYEGELPIIATNRAEWAGGDAPEEGRLDRLVAASEVDAVQHVDVELGTARERGGVIQDVRAHDVGIICSHHDFEATPDHEQLLELFEACARLGDIAKVATFAEDRGDALGLLTAVYEATQQDHRVAGMAMGADGSLSRVVAPFYGSVIGYAPLESDDEEYAPGQIPVHTLASIIGSLQESCG